MRTDLAKEAKVNFPDLAGIREEVYEKAGKTCTRISVETEEAARRLDKPMGIYTTVSFPYETLLSVDERMSAAQFVADELRILLPETGEILAVGLGNRYITADALGTKTVENVLITRHIREQFADILPNGTRSVCAFCTGVLGVTGMETIEVVTALCEKIRPAAVVIVDSLAANKPEHIGTVIQMNDTGISPGAGIGNFQTTLNRQTVGVPVIALGMPLVIGMDVLQNDYGSLKQRGSGYSVTPKDIDLLVKDAAKLLSLSLNLAFYGREYTSLQKLLQ